MGICVGKKGKIILLNSDKNEQNENDINIRIIKLYEKNTTESSSHNNDLKKSVPSFNSTEFSEINNDDYDSDINNNNNTFKEILDIFNVQKD